MDESMIPQDVITQISQRVARECAVIAAEADTNYDAEQEILARFDCDPTPVAGPTQEPISQLALEIRNLAHRAWEDRPNAELLFREIGKRAQKISERRVL